PSILSTDTPLSQIYPLSLHDALPISATFTPAATLAPLTTYTATISTGTRDLAGNALTADVSWSFTTGVIPDTTAPTVSATVPAKDRKSTRLNSSHEWISYAVFCLKKK